MAKPSRVKPPRAVVEKAKDGRLVPVTSYDNAVVGQARLGAIYELVPKTMKRSDKQLRLYWACLDKVCEATGAWPNSEILHDLLVREAGYVTRVPNPRTGEWEIARDSFALDSMEPEDANKFVDAALAILAEGIGVDPLELLPEREA